MCAQRLFVQACVHTSSIGAAKRTLITAREKKKLGMVGGRVREGEGTKKGGNGVVKVEGEGLSGGGGGWDGDTGKGMRKGRGNWLTKGKGQLIGEGEGEFEKVMRRGITVNMLVEKH